MNQRKVSAHARTIAVVATLAALAFAAAPAAAATASEQARIEARIASLHAKLSITAAEEAQWAQVADVMRENANKMNELNQARAASAKTMTALDDLRSYGEITDAHSAEIKKFAAVFEPLYVSMSDAQKADADALFRHGAGVHKSTKTQK